MTYDGPIVESFASSFGIEDESIANKQRYGHINVKVLRGNSYLDEDISGRLLSRVMCQVASSGIIPSQVTSCITNVPHPWVLFIRGPAKDLISIYFSNQSLLDLRP